MPNENLDDWIEKEREEEKLTGIEELAAILLGGAGMLGLVIALHFLLRHFYPHSYHFHW
jgi:hypothetical protein